MGALKQSDRVSGRLLEDLNFLVEKWICWHVCSWKIMNMTKRFKKGYNGIETNYDHMITCFLSYHMDQLIDFWYVSTSYKFVTLPSTRPPLGCRIPPRSTSPKRYLVRRYGSQVSMPPSLHHCELLFYCAYRSQSIRYVLGGRGFLNVS